MVNNPVSFMYKTFQKYYKHEYQILLPHLNWLFLILCYTYISVAFFIVIFWKIVQCYCACKCSHLHRRMPTIDILDVWKGARTRHLEGDWDEADKANSLQHFNTSATSRSHMGKNGARAGILGTHHEHRCFTLYEALELAAIICSPNKSSLHFNYGNISQIKTM